MSETVLHQLFDPNTAPGAAFLGLVFLVISLVLAGVIRRAATRLEPHLTDVTGLRFARSLAQLVVFLVASIFYAYIVPQLHALGTALLAGVSVVSLVLGLAAQSTLGNLIAGFSLVLYRPVRVGDSVQLSTPAGLPTATVELISLGYTHLRDTNGNEVIVPHR